MNKFERQGAILRLVQEQALATQAEVAEALREQGYEAVQTTVSRDIAQLGLVKVRGEGGRLVYALPGAADLSRLSELTAALRRWALALTTSGNLVLIVDQAHLPDVAGTLAGDNTIIVVAREGLPGAELVVELRHHLEGDT